MNHIIFFLAFSILTFAQTLSNDLAYQTVSDHLQGSNIPEAYIREAFTHDEIKIHKEIAEKFARPYEKKTWKVYRKIFVKDSRIAAGAKFYKENIELIKKVSDEYKVDPFIIVTIAGIESNYGSHHSQYSVFNSLYSQIHDMPKRAKWASKELAEFIKYCYNDHWTPRKLVAHMQEHLDLDNLFHPALTIFRWTLMKMA